MNCTPEMIVMLTHNDHTVLTAYDIFDQCKNCNVKYWGFKEKGLPADKMKNLYSYMKDCGKTTVLEVVAYSEPECLEGAYLAKECGCDILMGTLFYDSVNKYCNSNNLKYMPFVGNVKNRPSVLEGSIENMINQASAYLNKGVYGLDLLAYRYTGTPEQLINKFTSDISIPICIAGSIDSYEKLDCVKHSGASLFTIGSAFFENKFGNTFPEQIEKVYNYMNENKG